MPGNFRPPSPPGPIPRRGSAAGGPKSIPNTSILRVLTNTQNASAAVFGIFFATHLAAPVAAAVGGLAAADNVMVCTRSSEVRRVFQADLQILGRELYLPLETGIVYAPLFIHILSGAARRAYLTYKTRGRARVSNQAKAGWALIPLVLPHLWLHRIIPSTDAAPISSMSPSEFGYEFAGYGAATRPWMTVGYLALSAFGAYHALIGTMQVVSWLKRVVGVKPKLKAVTFDEPEEIVERRQNRIIKPIYTVVGGIVAVVALGLFRMAKDTDALTANTVFRYQAIYESAPWAALLH